MKRGPYPLPAAAPRKSARLEPVVHPEHYFHRGECKGCGTPIECIDVVQTMGFNLGNTVKYVWRAGQKDPAKTVEDLRKAREYLDFEIERLGGVP